MVVIFSQYSNSSPQVMREIERAVNKGVAIIPFRVENVMPSKDLEYFISSCHWLDAMNPPLEKHIGELADAILALQRRTAVTPAISEKEKGKPRKKSLALWAMLGLAAIVAAVGGAWFLRHKEKAGPTVII